MNKKANYPPHLSFIERLAKKVITRVVSDGIGLDNAVKEAVHVAKLNTQQIFHLCSVLEDYGQVFNGDSKNYYFTAGDMGKDFPNTQNGYVVYASANGTGKNARMNDVFKTVEALKKQGFSDQDILSINGELQEVLTIINEFNADYKTLVADYEAAKAEPQAAPVQDKSFLEKGKDWLGQQVEKVLPQPGLSPVPASSKSKVVFAQVGDLEEIEEATPENVQNVEDNASMGELDVAEEVPAAPIDDAALSVEEDEALTGGPVNAEVTPNPDELMSQIESAPKWEVTNILSMQKAENFFKDLQKKLDEVVYNPNINMDLGVVSQYDKVRAAIEAATNKISEAKKGIEKVEEKENELTEKYETPQEAPTEDLISEAPVEEAPTGEMTVEEEPAPIPQLG